MGNAYELMHLCKERKYSGQTVLAIVEPARLLQFEDRDELFKKMYDLVVDCESEEEIISKIEDANWIPRLEQYLTDSEYNLIKEFQFLVTNNSDDYQRYLEIAKEVGINMIFPGNLFEENTFLSFAIKYENDKLIEMLLKNGADPNQRSINGVHPLVFFDNKYENEDYGLRVTRLLLEYGADPNLVYNHALHYPDLLFDGNQHRIYLKKYLVLLEEYGAIEDPNYKTPPEWLESIESMLGNRATIEDFEALRKKSD